jgi:CDP-paratose 2-epimerase
VLDQISHMDDYAGRHWNVGGGLANSVSLREATALCAEVTGRTVQVTETKEDRPVDLPLYISDHRAVTAVRGWTPKRDARHTFTDIADWVDAHKAELTEVVFG